MVNLQRRTIAALLGVGMIAFGLSFPLATLVVNGDQATEGLHMKGQVDMILYNEAGKIKDERHLDNLIVDAGLQGVASRIAPHDGTINPSAAYNYIALGTGGDTAVAASQTSLVNELPAGANYGRLQDATATYSAVSGKKLILSVTFEPGKGTGTLSESGIFNAATSGDMLARQTFSPVQKAAGDTLTVTWTITLTPS